MDLSYKEQLDKLRIRIRAHKEFANFDVSDWIDQFAARKPRHAIFDLGCGNGNHLGIYLKHVGGDGRVAGLDREAKLIDEARQTYKDASTLELLVGSMDEPLPFDDATFDLCFSNFAIYNAANPQSTLGELRRVMKPGAELVLIGPTRNNALELYEYNKRLTGQAIDEITLIRTDRLRQEIEPIVKTVFGNAREEVLGSVLTFPTADEFLLYFKSTMLFEEGAERAGVTDEQMKAALPQIDKHAVSKEMLAVIATR
jgi:ubiquinone/menaquinone biosynthesis C-methylase UbiE